MDPCATRARRRRRMGLHAPNVAPIAALFCKKPTPSPLLLLLLPEFVELVGASTRVVIVTTPPSALVETTRVRRLAEMSVEVELTRSVVVGVVDVDWVVVEEVEELG